MIHLLVVHALPPAFAALLTRRVPWQRPACPEQARQPRAIVLPNLDSV